MDIFGEWKNPLFVGTVQIYVLNLKLLSRLFNMKNIEKQLLTL